jgi:hypothetical protein
MGRRAVLAGAAAALALRRASAQPKQKISKADAQYQEKPKDGQACGGCTLFQPPHSCQVVEGEISEHGWCRLFEEPPE